MLSFLQHLWETAPLVWLPIGLVLVMVIEVVVVSSLPQSWQDMDWWDGVRDRLRALSFKRETDH